MTLKAFAAVDWLVLFWLEWNFTIFTTISTSCFVHFYWVGDGQYKTKILDKLGKYENFHYLGFISYPDKVREYLTEIDIYALPTGMDTTPLSCREAMAMEKPIVASNVGGIPEMIYDGKTGFLVDEGNAEQWIDKISFLLKNENTAKEMGKAARQLIIEKFNWDILAKDFLTAVNPIIKAKNHYQTQK